MTSTGTKRWEGRVALVTGASAGIGAEICRQLVNIGMKVVGVARQHHRVEALAIELQGATGSLEAVKCDINKDAEVEDLFKHVLDKHGAVHLLVNNAGFSANHSLLEGTPSEWRAMLDVNVVALCLLSKLAVAAMNDKGVKDGHIIHIGSMTAYSILPYPSIHFYSATKHAVRALTEGLRQELRANKSLIRVSSVSPGQVATEFVQTMTGDAAASATALSASPEFMKAEDVAASVLHVLTSPPHVEIHDVLIRATEQAM